MSERTADPSPRWKMYGAEIAILALAAVLRFWRIAASSLWSDEGNTWAMIQRPFGEIALHAAADIHPPGYYWALKLWSTFAGTDAVAMRAFSALCGLLLVWVIVRIGGEVRRTHPEATPLRQWLPLLKWLPLLAGFVAAVNPFQIYYSQEARMYMLLALESALLMWALLWLLRLESGVASMSWRTKAPALALYGVAATLGLWTHYSFPIVLLAAGVAWLVWWLRNGHAAAPLLRFAAVNAVALALFAPWLPTAIGQLTTWPAGGASLPLIDGLVLTLRTLLLGLMHTLPAPAWLWLTLAGLLPVVGAFALHRRGSLLTLLLWLLLPVGMMAAFGLFTDAFLKFLLVASAPWCILVAASAEGLGTRAAPWLRIVVAVGAALFAVLALPPYWQDTNARDNYAGVAAYISATADPVTDVVLLNGPGQADVWRYYDTTFPTLPIPDARPADPQTVEEQLAQETADRRAVHAILWATEQSDPDNLVVNWLDTHLFKGQESWQNNIRYAQYFTGSADACDEVAMPLHNVDGEPILTLDAICRPDDDGRVAAGDPLIVQFNWTTDTLLDQRYKVSVQVIEGDSTVVAQHDSEPAGGSRPTTTWQIGETIRDRHAVLIPVGTIPGSKQVRLVIYHADTGESLRFDDGADHLSLPLRLTLPTVNPTVEMLPMDAIVNRRMEGVDLLGYSQYRKDYGHAPETPLAAGDTLRLILFWQAPNPLPEGWQPNEQVTITLGGATISAPLAGIDYPTEMWQPGQIVRGEFDVPYDGSATSVRVTVGDDVVRLAALPRAPGR